jgi:hypothetical protein
MPHPYDASTKYLFQVRLADWLPLIGRAVSAPVELVDADLSTVTAAADRLLLVYEDPPWIFHVELQSSHAAKLPANIHVYNALAARQHGVLVRSLALLLRSDADGPEVTGLFEQGFSEEPPYLVFRYQVVRVWQLPVEMLLKGGLGLLPLAPISAVGEAELPAVIRRMEERIDREAAPEEAGNLWTAVDVLMGLRYSKELIESLLRRVRRMKESVTYQAIIEEGREEGTRQILVRLLARKCGELPKPIQDRLNALSVGQLERLGENLLEFTNLADLTKWLDDQKP